MLTGKSHILLSALTVILLPAFSIACVESESNENTMVIMYTNAENGLNVRKKPSVDAPKAGILSFASEVQVIKKTKKPVTIDGRKGFWVHVQTLMQDPQIEGWVFDAYLSDAPPIDDIPQR